MRKTNFFKSLLLIVFAFFLSNKNALSQCTFTSIFSDSYEYSTVIPYIVPGSTYQNTPQTFPGCIHSGSQGLYLNIVNGYLGMIYDQPFDNLCVGGTYQFSMWTRDAWSSSNDFTFQVLSSDNQVLCTQTIVTNSTWANVALPSFVATTSTIRFQIITNIAGGPGNDGAVDDLTLSVCTPDPSNYTVAQCAGSGTIDLYPLINAPAMSQSGTWTGPSSLNNGYIGTYDPTSNTNGTYQYTVAGIAGCPDSVANVNVDLITNPSIDPLGPINSCSAYTLPAITGTNLASNVNYYTAQNGGGTIVPVGTSISTPQTLYMYTGAAGCSDEQPLVITFGSPGNAGSDNGSGFCGSGSSINLNTFLSAGATTGGTWSETTVPPSGSLNPTTGVWNSAGVNPGNYTFQYSTPTVVGCVSDVANFVMNIGNVPDVEIGNDTILCQGQTLLLDAGAGYDTYLWNNGSSATTQNVSAPGTYAVTVSTLGSNIIINGDFEQGNTGFLTDYGPGTGGSWGLLSNEGTYAVSSSPSNVHNNFSFCNDHTSAPGVNQLIVNGSSIPNQNIWCQTIPVQANTTYQFGAWVSSVVNDPSLGQLQFSINNVPIGSIFSPLSTPCSWSQFTQNWSSGSATSAQICITSQSLSTSGNDFAIDDITFRPMCQSQDTVVVTYSTPPVVNLGADQSLCSGQTATLDAQNPGFTYLWNTTETSQSINVTTTGTYTVTVTNLQNCSASDNVDVTFQNLQLAGTDATTQICSTQAQLDLTTMLQATASPGGSWNTATPSFGGTLNANGTLDLTGQIGSFDFDYVVNSAFCPNDTAVMTVIINQQPVATVDQSFSFCNTAGTSVDFSPYLNNPSEPIPGVWTIPGTLPIVAFNTTTNVLDLSNLNQGVYTFDYVLPPPTGCVQDNLSITVSVTEVPVVLFASSVTEGCEPLQVTFTNLSNPQGSLEYQWDLGNGVTSTSSTTVPTEYQDAQCYDVSLTITADGMCTSTLALTDMICVSEVPVADFALTPSELVSNNPTVQTTNSSTNNDFNNWYFSDGGHSEEINPSYTFPMDSAGNYSVQLIVTTNYGCTDTLTKLIEVVESVIYYIPNTFTPDGDEHNNVFKPILTSGIDVNNYTLKIFNRWGEYLFESHDVSQGWDGTYGGEIVPQGSYTWEIQFGVKQNDRQVFLTGHITLIR